MFLRPTTSRKESHEKAEYVEIVRCAYQFFGVGKGVRPNSPRCSLMQLDVGLQAGAVEVQKWRFSPAISGG